MFLHNRTVDEDQGTKEEPVYIIEKLSDPFVVLTYSISSSVLSCTASLASLFSTVTLLYLLQ